MAKSEFIPARVLFGDWGGLRSIIVSFGATEMIRFEIDEWDDKNKVLVSVAEKPTGGAMTKAQFNSLYKKLEKSPTEIDEVPF